MKMILKSATVIGILLFLPGCSLFRSSSVTEEEKTLPEESTTFARDDFEIDQSQSLISFVGKKGGVFAHEGKFEDFQVNIESDEAEPGDFEKAQINATIDIKSMVTDSDGLTDHLLNPDFFESETYPEATFTSTNIQKQSDDQYVVEGELTMKGVTQPVTLNTQLTNEFLYAEYDLNRLDFGIGEEGAVDTIVPMTFKMVFAS